MAIISILNGFKSAQGDTMTDKSYREEMISELKRKVEENRISEELNAYLFPNSHEAYLYRRRKEKESQH